MWKEPEINANNWPSADQLSGLWVHLMGELSIRTLLYYQAAKCRCWIEQLLSENNMTTSTLVFDKDSGAPYLKSQHNVEMLGLICLEADGFEIVLSTLSVMLNQMREVPLLIQICTKDLTQPEIEGLATQILRRCQELLMPNAYRSNLTLYPTQLDNLYGHVLRTQPDLAQPYTFMYRDGKGKLVISGVAWHLVKEFARQLNASLQLSFEPTASKSVVKSYYTIIQHARNRTIDISSSFISPHYDRNLQLFSYPVFTSSWCIMLP
ncbi:GH23401 [Drosophila grimshawi]|uniref:GH23401 n=1 Tax=Drosophila grimshawi TaxID=7222 RepID=B4K1Z0_DROGR|nr:GH23401 [Drosophila grimshawi]